MPVVPTSGDGLATYLGSGVLPGIGPVLARRIVQCFGDRTIEVLGQNPDRLREVRGVPKAGIGAIGAAWGEQRAMTEVMVFLQAHGA